MIALAPISTLLMLSPFVTSIGIYSVFPPFNAIVNVVVPTLVPAIAYSLLSVEVIVIPLSFS